MGIRRTDFSEVAIEYRVDNMRNDRIRRKEYYKENGKKVKDGMEIWRELKYQGSHKAQ